MTLHLYFARKFVKTFLGLVAGFGVFLWLVELLENVRRFGGSAGFGKLAWLSLLHLPELLYQILTLIVLLASVVMFLNLARTSELVVSRASGRSALGSLMAPLLAAALMGGLVVAFVNPVVASLSRAHENALDQLRGEDSVVSLTREGLWLRQGRADRQIAIHAARANLDGTRLFDVTFFGFEPDGTPLYRVDAAEAGLTDGAWLLTDAKRWTFEGTVNPEATSERLETMRIASNLTEERIRDSFGTPSSIPIWDLAGFIVQLETAGFSARSHRVWFQSELARPLGFAAMVLVGAVFTLRHTRMGRTGVMVLLAVLSGFAVYLAGNLTTVMGENGQIPVSLAVWTPPVAAICLALAGLLHTEDG
jgi:lipopolysaccharide export system permease protein